MEAKAASRGQRMKLLDTSVLVEIDRGNSEEKIEKLDSEGNHGISQVSVTEMFLGIEYKYKAGTEEYQEMREQLERLLSRFNVIPINRSISVKAAKIIAKLDEKGQPVDDLHDTYIAATAVKKELDLLTKNQQHFENVEEIEVKSWEDY